MVQPLVRICTGLYAARSYAEAHGLPKTEDELADHQFVCADIEQTRAPFHRWLRSTVPPERISYTTTEQAALEAAVRMGAGIGFIAAFRAEGDDDLVEVMPPRPEWDSPLRIVTHVDLHRTRKVQAFLSHLKEAAKEWRFCA